MRRARRAQRVTRMGMLMLLPVLGVFAVYNCQTGQKPAGPASPCTSPGQTMTVAPAGKEPGIKVISERTVCAVSGPAGGRLIGRRGIKSWFCWWTAHN